MQSDAPTDKIHAAHKWASSSGKISSLQGPRPVASEAISERRVRLAAQQAEIQM